jgi:hypothetical protein
MDVPREGNEAAVAEALRQLTGGSPPRQTTPQGFKPLSFPEGATGRVDGKAREGTQQTPGAAADTPAPPEDITGSPLDAGPESGSLAGAPGDPGNFQFREARRDLANAHARVREVMSQLDSISGQGGAAVAEVQVQIDELDRLLGQIAQMLDSGRPVSAGVAAAATVQVELLEADISDAAKDADETVKGVLTRVLSKLGWVGRQLLKMNLHLFPVKEWTVGGEANALFLKGTISVTFGKQ